MRFTALRFCRNLIAAHLGSNREDLDRRKDDLPKKKPLKSVSNLVLNSGCDGIGVCAFLVGRRFDVASREY